MIKVCMGEDTEEMLDVDMVVVYKKGEEIKAQKPEMMCMGQHCTPRFAADLWVYSEMENM